MFQQDEMYQLIRPKIVPFSELVICLFENCNMSCHFCPQDHSSIVGMSSKEILSKVQIVNKYIAQNTSQIFHIHLMGGELFQDNLIDEGFLEIYETFIQEILRANPDKDIVINPVTNLAFLETQKVKSFLIRNNIKMSISYDLAGRFSSKQFEIFKNNISLLKDHIRMVSCVITKPNIKALMNNDSYFDYLYKNFSIDWDQLIPSLENSKHLMPAQSELLDFYKYLTDHYPNCINLENFFNEENYQSMRCTRGNSLTIMPDNTIPFGCSGSLLLKKSNTKDLGGTQIIEKYLQKHDCYTCEFYHRCPFTCFIKEDYKHLVNDIDECVFKETFKYIASKKGNIMNFANVKEELKTKGFVIFNEPSMNELIDIPRDFELPNYEERLRDNGEKDLPADLNQRLKATAVYLQQKYLSPNWEKSQFVKYIIWDGVDMDNQLWHTDEFEGMNLFFLYYFDDTKIETGGGIHFKAHGEEYSYQPKKGDLILVNNTPGYFHRVDDTNITRRVSSFDFLIEGEI